MPRYLKLPKEPEFVDAFQWNPDNSDIPECTLDYCGGSGQGRHTHIFSKLVREGEWVISSEREDVVLDDDEFTKRYVLAQDRLKVKTLTKTCDLCPSQWEGELEDGRMIYIRIRHDYLSVRVSKKEGSDIKEAVRGAELLCTVSDAYTTKDMIEETKSVLDFSNANITDLPESAWDFSNVEPKPMHHKDTL